VGQKTPFLWRFCAFLNKESSKTPQKTFLEKAHDNFFLPKRKKVEGKNTFPL
jgi:hypothetical protein